MADPSTIEISDRSASRNIWFTSDESSTLLASHQFPVEEKRFVLSFASPAASGVALELLGPDGKSVDATIKEQLFPVSADQKDDIPIKVFIINNAAIGIYTFNMFKTDALDANVLRSVLNNPMPDAVLTFIVDDDVWISSRMQSYVFKVGQEIGLMATIKTSATDVLMSVNKGMMAVTLPDGTSVDVDMHDDGFKGGDMVAGDAVYSGKMVANTAGVYILESILDGDITSNAFERTSQHVITVSSATVELSGKATMKPIDNERATISLIVDNTNKAQPQLRGYAEVWGTTLLGSVKAACWIGGITEVSNGKVDLELNLKWLQRAGVQGPLVLKNVYLSDITTSFPVTAYAGDIKVLESQFLRGRWPLHDTEIPITKEMRWGINPLNVTASPTNVDAPNLLLLPGYCTDVNPWSRKASDFTNAFFPVDKGNFANHEYATKIISLVEEQKMSTFGVIGHSQGGMVAVHMHNYFWTGLEESSGARRIQTLGTPFQGNTAAGSAANLGEIFGVGCGANPDLSIDGAANWITGISTEARSAVHFYTTSYEQGNFFGDYCSLPMNLVLQWPNDGVTEIKYSKLPGAVDMGTKEKWCHSTEMGYSPQYDDSARNKEMNEAAMR